MDKVFSKPIKKQFEFDEEVAAVFDDMLSRSVPFYEEAQKITEFFVLKYLKEDGVLYDLGSSTASLLINLSKSLHVNAHLIGIDNSSSMIERAKLKAKALNVDIELIQGDILEYEYDKANVFVSNYTLQFIRPLERERLIKKLYDALEEEGIFVFSEKLISHDKRLNKELIELYYDFKKQNGYSEYEIAQKREALENVLVPYSEEENITMIKNAGFSHCEVVFRWANFATFIAVK
ncbi:MAG: carboxy-S-adenosyl-L-methionine synthase CmoA [Epsilonproteobacteria bacterium]|nr:carboxy-S-adenosyl-L-methionine synthase CmoA [Campylobacterota bacterium]